MTDDNSFDTQPAIAFNQEAAKATLVDLVDASSSLFDLSNEELELIEAVCELSPFLADCTRREHEFLASAFARGFEETLQSIISDTARLGLETKTEDEVMSELRTNKRRLALVSAVADLGCFWTAARVTKALSDFAKSALSASIDFILLSAHSSEKLQLVDTENPQFESGLIVLGMGKFGAEELNYSSDIDLIIFFDDQAKIKLHTDDPITLLVRMVKQLVKLMQERTGDGYVFRTDLRLRPDPSSTPVVIPVDAALNYYEGQGQNWERAAMIKATPVAGDVRAAEQFLSNIGPFIWRKYLDFAAIQDVHSIKRQIHAHKGHGEIAVQGHNIKLGRGGIREIEFFAQTQQLIAGGRNPNLREKRTVDALNALAKEGWIEASTAIELSTAYWFLRNLEHRLQMIDDAQTHTLPETADGIELLARMFGIRDAKTFSKALEACLKLVERHYAELFETAPELSAGHGNLVFTGDDTDPDTAENLSSLGFGKPVEAIKLIKQWHVAKYPALQASAAREMLTELVPDLLQAFSKSSDPDAVLYTFDRFIAGLPAGIQLFAILKSNPSLNALIVRILVAAPSLAEQIAQKPHVFDAMLEPQIDENQFSRERLEQELMAGLGVLESYEQKLDHARRFFREIRFQVSCRYLSGSFNSDAISNALSSLAEAMVSVMFETVREEFSKAHGTVEGATTCILAMGRLGSRELTTGSDLDLIFLYDFPSDIVESTGERPLDPTLYFIRLIKRFITAMSAPTAEGYIFELDFRLRPSGNAGPLATQVDGFFKYQMNEAWVWETQALSRARIVAGDQAICKRVAEEIPRLLTRHASSDELAKEIKKMRLLIDKEKPGFGIWDMKSGKGGLIDIEFISQWLVLASKEAIQSVPISTHAKISQLAGDHLNPGQIDTLLSAYETFTTVLQMQRTCYGDSTPPDELTEGFSELICTALDLPDVANVEAHLKETKIAVRGLFNEILGEE